jgi:hypothetical protein
VSSLRKNPRAQPYQGTHLPPNPEYGAPAHDVEKAMPDYYAHPEWYATGSLGDNEAASVLRKVRGKPWTSVWVYRAVPKGVDKLLINPGDWVTTVRAYAIEHAQHILGGKSKVNVLRARVRAGELFTDGNSHLEWGWWPAVPEQIREWEAARRQHVPSGR